jgi:3-hydroxybutyryl-CoA dehydrogenase
VLRVAVTGTGLMGRGIAAVFAGKGHAVSLYDSDATALETAVAALAGDTGETGDTNDSGVAAAPPASVRAERDLAAAVEGADVVIEAIVENLDAKRALFAKLDALLPTAVLATNTSVLPVSLIAERTERPDRVVGTHWWNPPQLIPIVEVVRGRHTSEATMDRAVELLGSLGKTPVRVERDVPGFVGNRLQHALWREAIALVADGVCDAETVDLVVRETLGLRLGAMGPLENADYVGLDLTLAIHEAVLPSLNRDAGPSSLLRAHVAAGDLGAKTGRGFLAWPPGTREAAARRLRAHVVRQQSSVVRQQLSGDRSPAAPARPPGEGR